MFNHLNSSASQSFFGRIIAGFKGHQYLRVTVDENSGFFGGIDAPVYIKQGDTILENQEFSYIIADEDTVFNTLQDSDNTNMLSGYMGSFTNATTLKEMRIIRARKDKKIKDILLTSGAVWGIK